VFDTHGKKHSTLDLCGKGLFTLITGIGGEAWAEAAKAAAKKLGLTIKTRVIGPRRDFEDHGGEWAAVREISDAGCLLVRPDQHVAFRAMKHSNTSNKDLADALNTVLGH